MKRALLCGFCLLLVALTACGREAKKGPFTVILSVEANTLDPHFATATIEWSILMNMFDPLIERRGDMTLGPALAERWEVDETKKVWTFHLRKGVKFHNGEPFDAESVRYTFDRMRDKKLKPRITVYRRIFLDRIEKVDSHTVKIHTKRPVATLPVWMVNAFMLPPRYYSSTPPKELLKKPVGTGPYKLVKWIKDDRIEMAANKGWWRGKPAIKKVFWRPVAEASARIAELETGGADIIMNISPDQSKTILARGEGLQLKGTRGGRRIYLGIRTDHGVLGDVRIRRALNHAIDFEAIAKNVFLGHGSRMRSIVNPPNAAPDMKAYAYDPRKAKALLAEAGLKDTNGDGVLEMNGKPFEIQLEVPASRYLKGKEISEFLAAYFRTVGVHVEVIPLEWSVFLARRRKKTLAPLYFHGFSSAFNEELDLGVLRPNLFANLTAWRNREFIRNYKKLGQTFDPAERRRISYRMQRIVRADSPWVFLWNQYDFFGLSARTQWTPRPDERIYLPTIRLKEVNP